MTYKLCHNGTEYGPYTRQEIAEKHGRGELHGILWRRVGDGDYKPHTDLDAELATSIPPKLKTTTTKDLKGGSRLGGVIVIFGVLWGLFELVSGTNSGNVHNIGLISDREVGALAALGCIIIGCTLEITSWLRRIANSIARDQYDFR